MKLEALETRIDEFAERNLVLQLALGLLSAADRFDHILEDHVPSEAATRAAELDAEDERLIEFTLGLIRFRDVVRGLAHRTAGDDDEVDVVGLGDSSPFLGALR